MEANEPPEVSIPEGCITGLHDGSLCGVWGAGNSLALFGRHFSAAAQPTSGGGAVIFEWDHVFEATRKLIVESHSVFTELQRVDAELEAAGLTPGSSELTAEKQNRVGLSVRQLRALITTCQTRIQTTVAESTHMPAEEAEELQAAGEVLMQVESGLHLVTIMFVLNDDTPVVPHLVNWLYRRLPHERLRVESMLDDDAAVPDDNPDFWPTVYRCVAVGWITDAQELLNSSSVADHALFATVEDLLRVMPSLLPQPAVRPSVLSQQWTEWRAMCREVQQQVRGVGGPEQLARIVDVLCGDDAALQSASATWLELLVATLIYQHSHPMLSASHIGRELPVQCVERMGAPASEAGAAFTGALVAMLAQDALETVVEIRKHVGLPLVAAHIADILFHMRFIDGITVASGADLREAVVLEFVESIWSDRALWQVALDYLTVCPRYGPSYARLIIERQPIGSEMKAHKLEARCLRNVPVRISRTALSSVVGMERLRDGRWAAALYWFARADNRRMLNRVTHRLLSAYLDAHLHGDSAQRGLVDGELSAAAALIGRLGGSVAARLTVVRLVAEFECHLRSASKGEAARALVAVVEHAGAAGADSELYPPQLIVCLILRARPLLSADESEAAKELGVAATTALLRALNDRMLSVAADEYLKGIRGTELVDLRKALCSRVSQAVVEARAYAVS